MNLMLMELTWISEMPIVQEGHRVSFYTFQSEENPFQLGYGEIMEVVEGVREDDYAVYYIIKPDFLVGGKKEIERDEHEVNPDLR